MATCVLLLAALAPLLVVETPAMIDYLNHLARMEVLTARNQPLAYAVAWRLYPNSAMDLIVPPLGRLIGAGPAAKAFLALSLTLIVSGAVALERAVKGRHEFAGLCALAILFSLPVTWGLVNFTLGLGVALWGVALWVAARPKAGVRLWLTHGLIVVALFVSHFFALGLYGFSIGLIELSAVAMGKARLASTPVLGLKMAAPVAVVLLTMAAAGGTIGTPEAMTWDFGLKGLWLLQFMNAYDRLLAAALFVAVATLVVWLTLSRRLRLTAAGVFIAVGLAALYLALPVRLFGVAYVDVRLLTWAPLVLPAFATAPPGRWRFAPAAVLAAIAVANGAATVSSWLTHRQDYAEIRRSFPLLAPGAAVLIGIQDHPALSDQPLFYAPTLAVPEADVFVSSFYCAPTSVPIVPRPPYVRMSVTRPIDYVPPTVSALAGKGELPPQLRHWAEDFRYLYLIGPPPAAAPIAGLTPIASGRRFTLYRIEANARKPQGA